MGSGEGGTICDLTIPADRRCKRGNVPGAGRRGFASARPAGLRTADGRITFSHVLVVWLMASGTVMGGASYYLAFRGVTDTLETLAHYVMVETVAGSAGYLAKSTMENVLGSKKTPPGQDV